jgi:RimJ/RimL family protein N-acetyltransferase
VTDRPYVLTTERLLLLPLGPEHAAELAEVYADPEVHRYIGGPDLDLRAQADRFRAVWNARGWGQSAVLEKATGRLLGRAGLGSWGDGGDVELGYALRRDAWGHGYAQEACRAWLAWSVGSFESLLAVIHPANAASRRTATALGFTLDRLEDVDGRELAIYRKALRPRGL